MQSVVCSKDSYESYVMYVFSADRFLTLFAAKQQLTQDDFQASDNYS